MRKFVAAALVAASLLVGTTSPAAAVPWPPHNQPAGIKFDTCTLTLQHGNFLGLRPYSKIQFAAGTCSLTNTWVRVVWSNGGVLTNGPLAFLQPAGWSQSTAQGVGTIVGTQVHICGLNGCVLNTYSGV